MAPDGTPTPFATDLGVACGLAFAPDGTLFVGDRSGTIFRVTPDGRASTFASLPASVAAFHLAMGPDGALFATAPTLSSYDSVYRIDAGGTVTTRYGRFGRPQGLAFDARGSLFVVEALAGASGLYRLPPDGEPELVLAAPALVGVAFDSQRARRRRLERHRLPPHARAPSAGPIGGMTLVALALRRRDLVGARARGACGRAGATCARYERAALTLTAGLGLTALLLSLLALAGAFRYGVGVLACLGVAGLVLAIRDLVRASARRVSSRAPRPGGAERFTPRSSPPPSSAVSARSRR